MKTMYAWMAVLAAAFLSWSCKSTSDSRSPDSGYVGATRGSERAIVFVHGFRGGWETWMNERTGSDWPTLLTKDPIFNGQDGTSPSSDVFVFVHPTRWNSGYSIQDAARLMFQVLEKHHVTDHRELIFVAHSMGGLVTLEFLTQVGRQYAAKTRLVYLVATPGLGSDFAKLGRYVGRNPQIGQMIEGGSESYLTNLKLAWLDREGGTEVLCAYETEPEDERFQVVTVNSALAFAKRGNRWAIGADCDHSQIAGPDTDDPVYITLSNAYESLDGSPAPAPEPGVSLRLARSDGVVPFSLDVTAVAEGMRPVTYRWYRGTEELPLTDSSGRIEITHAGEVPVRVVASDGKTEHEDTVIVRAAAREPRSETRVVTAEVETSRRNLKEKWGDDEIDSDDWSKIAVEYSTRIIDSGRTVELTLTWDAFELEGNKSFKKGNTRFQSSRTMHVWEARNADERVVTVLAGGSGSVEYLVKGKCVGPRTYGAVGGIAHPVITFDAQGDHDDRVQAFVGTLELTLAVETGASGR